MPAPLTGYINDWRGDYIGISGNLWSMGSYLINAATALKLEFFEQAAYNLDAAGDSAHVASQLFSGGASNVYDDMYSAMHWIDGNMDGGDVTMAAMLNAMLGASPYELTYFIGLVDAYRSAIWEKPFNAEFFAALARGFMT